MTPIGANDNRGRWTYYHVGDSPVEHIKKKTKKQKKVIVFIMFIVNMVSFYNWQDHV